MDGMNDATLPKPMDPADPLFQPQWAPGPSHRHHQASGVMQVEAFSRHVGGEQHASASVEEIVQTPLPLACVELPDSAPPIAPLGRVPRRTRPRCRETR